jgi:hypothetical protein
VQPRKVNDFAEERGFEPASICENAEQFEDSEGGPEGAPPLDIEAKCANPGGVSQCACQSNDPRAELTRALAQALSGAISVGDIGTAQIAHEALGKLIAQATPGDRALVIDLNQARRDHEKPPE